METTKQTKDPTKPAKRELDTVENVVSNKEEDNSNFLIRHVILYALFFLLNIPITVAIAIAYLAIGVYELYIFIPVFLVNALIFTVPYHLAETYRRITRKANVILVVLFSMAYLIALYFYLY